MSLSARLSVLAPSTFRGRIALAIVASLVVAVIGVQLALSLLVDQRLRAEVASTLRQQGNEIAATYQRDGYAGVAQAKRYLPGTQVVVQKAGVTVFWSDPVRVMDATVTVTSGDVEVTLQREASAGVFGEWAIPLVIAAFIFVIGGLGWWFADLAARRLRRDAALLANQAEAVAGGDLNARVEVQDDELARVATSLNAMTQRLSDADRRQRLFLADVAHELRTPVTAIDGFAQAMVDGVVTTDEARLEAAKIIHEESQRLARLVADLQSLTMTDLDADPIREPSDLVELARDAATRLEAAAAERGVLLRGPEGTQQPITVATNPAQVETILGNLITNALRATPAGGTVRVAAHVGDGEIVLSVTDTGVGISAAHLPTHLSRASQPVVVPAGALAAAASPDLPPLSTHLSRASQPVVPAGAPAAAASPEPTHLSRASQPVVPAGALAAAASPEPTHLSRASQPVFLVLIVSLFRTTHRGWNRALTGDVSQHTSRSLAACKSGGRACGLHQGAIRRHADRIHLVNHRTPRVAHVTATTKPTALSRINDAREARRDVAVLHRRQPEGAHASGVNDRPTARQRDEPWVSGGVSAASQAF